MIYLFRLATSIKLLSNLPAGSPPPSRRFPSLLYVLSSMIWYAKDIEDLCHEETFRSLVDFAFSLEPGTIFKMSVNALLCSLCSINPEHFSLLLASCKDVLTSETGRVGQRLNTLAYAAQSFHCTEVLLGSNLVAQMISRLTNGFERLLELAYQPSPKSLGVDEREGFAIGVRGMISCLCSLLAFLTDFVRNWRPGKEWMAGTDNHRFWFPMIEFLSMDTAIMSALELAFIQEVAYEFFCVCLAQCDQTKRLFVQLVCDSLHNPRFCSGTPEPASQPILTPFLHKLLVGLVFQQESIPVILKVIPPEDPSKASSFDPLSLSSTYDILDFHPSYPIDHLCYYMHVPGSFTLAQFQSLVKSHNTAKTTPLKLEKSLHKKPFPFASSKLAPSAAKVLAKPPLHASVPVADSGSYSMDIANFNLKEWKIPTPLKEAVKAVSDKACPTRSYCLLDYDSMDGNKNFMYRNFIEMYKKQEVGKKPVVDNALLCDIVPFGNHYPMVVIVDEKTMFFAAERLGARDLDMYNMFASCNGLVPLARSVPPLYPYIWPSSLAAGHGQPPQQPSSDNASRQLFKSHTILSPPSVTPFRSIVMLGLSLQLEEFGKLLGKNPPIAYVLMRLLLGEDVSVQGQWRDTLYLCMWIF